MPRMIEVQLLDSDVELLKERADIMALGRSGVPFKSCWNAHAERLAEINSRLLSALIAATFNAGVSVRK